VFFKKQEGIESPSEESEQVTEEDIKKLIEEVKLLKAVMEYCSKNPKECE
tara:strand:+ start:330 stop:479 length:150 start_codon:yes stop_codon:yes gene_type:complete